MTDKFLTIADVAAELGIGVIQVRRLDDDLKPTRVGKVQMRLYRPSVVERVKKDRVRRGLQ